MSDRVKRIEDMLSQSPDDQFLRYSLAMELRKEGESERCTSLFKGLIADDPPHIPAFLMFAQYCVENSHSDEAASVLREGIESAKAQGELHAAGEMSELLSAIADQ